MKDLTSINKSFTDQDIQIPAKLTRPHIERVVYRERLFKSLDDGCKEPIIWTCGPGGSGKTTLVSSYIEAQKRPCLWYQIDESDTDLASFFHYLSIAGQQFSSGQPKDFTAFTPDCMRGLPEFSRKFFQTLAENVPQPSFIVFDNCQLVTDDALFFKALLDGMNRLPAGVTLLFLSQFNPPPLFSRLRLNKRLKIIGWPDLRMLPDEFLTLASMNGVREDQFNLPLYFEKMDGWVAGLNLVIEHCQMLGEPPTDFDHATPEAIFDFFSNEVIKGLSPEKQDFLYKTAFLPEITVENAQKLTGNPNAYQVLDVLHRQNFFTDKRDQAVPAYQYHPLFKAFLEQRVREIFAPEKVCQLQHAAAGLLINEGNNEDAARLLISSQDWEGLVGLIMKQAPLMLQQGRNQTLEGWLRAFPSSLLDNNPWLQLWLGASSLPYAPPESQKFFEKAFTVFRENPDGSPGPLLAFSGVIEAIHFAFTDLRQLDRWLDLLPEFIGSPEQLPPGEIGARVACSVYAAMIVYEPHSPNLASWEASALRLAETTGDLLCKVQIYFHALFRGVHCGDMLKILRMRENISKALSRQNAPPYIQILEKFAHVYEACLVNRKPLEAVNLVDEALIIAENSGVRILDGMLLGTGAQFAYIAGDLKIAERFLQKINELSPAATPWEESFFNFHKGMLAFNRGDGALAADFFKRSFRLAEDAGITFSLDLCHCPMAVAMAGQGSHDDALQTLLKGKRNLEASGGEYHVFEFELVEAYIRLAKGDEECGLKVLAKALKDGRERGYPGSFLCPLPWVKTLILVALENEIEVDYAKELIRICSFVPDEPPVNYSHWPWPLRIFTLGKFEVCSHTGAPLRNNGKSPQKPLELLKVLISLGGIKASEERISDALWPDADGDAARQAFKTTLHRLRKWLGVPDALEYTEGRLTLNPQICWVDAWAMEQLFRNAEKEWASQDVKDIEEGNSMASKACALYRGNFLADEVSQQSAVFMRERLRNRFVRGVERLGAHLEKVEKKEAAALHYRKALEIDPLIEEFYQRLIICYRDLGRTSEALSTYERCHQVLNEALGVLPSEKTKQFYQSL